MITYFVKQSSDAQAKPRKNKHINTFKLEDYKLAAERGTLESLGIASITDQKPEAKMYEGHRAAGQ